MSYEAEIGYRIGPCVCSPHFPAIAKELILKCIEAIGSNAQLYVGVSAVNGADVGLQDLDFKLTSRNIRMYFGKKIIELVKALFSMGGAENG